MRALFFAAALALFSSSAFAANEAGKYQAVLGDCAGCHGKNLAGGVVLMTPFGKIVTPNITPDKDSGIGNYSAEDFRKAMKTGMAPGGKRLYPAMPYPYYARMPDADVDALWAYLRSVKPVKNAVTVNQLHFPFNLRVLMAPWNALFFKQKYLAEPVVFVGDRAVPLHSDRSRGEYLVNGPGHCASCHSPKNFFGADKGPLTGASLQGWFAPDLSGNRIGLGQWSDAELVEYLKTGRNAHSIASGPMAEVVENSTSQMTDSDLAAMAAYLKSLPSSPANDGAPADAARMSAGADIYRVNCSACHGGDGSGQGALVPPLRGNAVILQGDVETLARVVLAGSRAGGTARAPTRPAMPSLGWRLNDAQVADVLSYVRGTWGNGAGAVDADTVTKIRANLKSGS